MLSIAGEQVSTLEVVRLTLIDRGRGEELWVDWIRREGTGRQDKPRRLSAPQMLL